MRKLNFLIPAHLDEGLLALKERDGVVPAESIRRALEVYLREKGILRPHGKGGSKTGK